MESNEQHPEQHPDDRLDGRPEQGHGPVQGEEAGEAGALQRELAALREERLRERADLENQRRRMVRELEQARRFANERLLGDLLPVLDSLERGLEAGGIDGARLREGVELTLKLLTKVVEDNGLSVVDPQGQAFDPERHQAMSTGATAERAPDEVVQGFQKGYILNDRLLRPALVVVARAPEA